jgi:DNA mismatch endonuclease, patch repair protein
VRGVLRELGLSYRLKNRDLPGSPDVANRRAGWAVFVHGCFWHRHTGCVKATVPKRNRAFWLAKLVANRRRDTRAVRTLRRLGYHTVTVWECELERPAHVRRLLMSLVPPARS